MVSKWHTTRFIWRIVMLLPGDKAKFAVMCIRANRLTKSEPLQAETAKKVLHQAQKSRTYSLLHPLKVFRPYPAQPKPQTLRTTQTTHKMLVDNAPSAWSP